MNSFVLYLLCAVISFVITFASLPLLRRSLAPYFMDVPGGLKKHAAAVPVLGGAAIMLGLAGSLIFIRFSTHFPTGTLHALRGVLLGAGLVFLAGVADDMHKPRGIRAGFKLLAQSAAAVILMCYGVQIDLFQSPWLNYPLTFFWIIGITNAFNLLDIADGLCVSQAAICAAGLAVISFPSEFIYVNFAALAVLGACIGFWPFNFSRKYKTFLGDSGSMLLGFMLAALCLGTGYTQRTTSGFLAPFFILAVPLFDTLFVMFARLIQGKNPLLGSDDHIVLRLKRGLKLSQRHILTIYIVLGIFNNLLAFALTHCHAKMAAAVVIFSTVYFAAATVFLLHIGKK